MTHINLTFPIRIQNVLLATDFSDASVAAVGHAAAVARSYQGKVDIVHVVVPEVYWWAPPESLPNIEEGIQIWAEKKMKGVLQSEHLRDCGSSDRKVGWVVNALSYPDCSGVLWEAAILAAWR